MSKETGLIFGWLLDGSGGGSPVGWAQARSWSADQGVMWLHLDRTNPECERWLEQESGLDPVIVEALMAEETRPRTSRFGDGLLVIFRGVNLNPGADPEDMVTVRLWVEATWKSA